MSWSKKSSKWQAIIQKDGKKYYLGLFSNEKEAALAYNKAAKEMFGEFVNLNEVG